MTAPGPDRRAGDRGSAPAGRADRPAVEPPPPVVAVAPLPVEEGAAAVSPSMRPHARAVRCDRAPRHVEARRRPAGIAA